MKIEPHYDSPEGQIYYGNALDVLRSMPSESVQVCVTSPPYWALRDYGLPPMTWDAVEECEHMWGDMQAISTGRNDGERSTLSAGSYSGGGEDKYYVGEQTASQGQFCQLCGAWRGCLGLEPTPELYIKHMVQIFQELRRVLRNDGTFWLNMGDSYAAGKPKTYNSGGYGDPGWTNNQSRKAPPGLKPKDLCGIPWALAFALRADGWWLRSAMPWVKRSAMPESATDRPASALEYMFLLTKSQKYYFDMNAIRKQQSDGSLQRWGSGGQRKAGPKAERRTGKPTNVTPGGLLESGRNLRNADLFFESLKEPFGMIFCGDEMVGIDCNTQAMKEAHFAAFPEKLIEPCVLAGTSEKGCCVECGAAWERVVERRIPELRDVESRYPGEHTLASKKYQHGDPGPESRTIGWRPTCKCSADKEPCIVLDPFGGTMTAALVAHKHGRKFIMIELSRVYIDEIGIPRIDKTTEQLKLFNRR